MNTNQGQTTAKIYQFPRGGSGGAGRLMAPVRSAGDRRTEIPTVDFGSGWYHEAAMQAERPRRS